MYKNSNPEGCYKNERLKRKGKRLHQVIAFEKQLTHSSISVIENVPNRETMMRAVCVYSEVNPFPGKT